MLGLLAIIIPGGFGVREGIMVFYLVLLGIPLEIAGGIAVLARLWFIIGEIFIFLLAVGLNLFIKKGKAAIISDIDN